MKRIGYLFEQICDEENIKRAIITASKGKRDRARVKTIIDNADHYALMLKWLLESKIYEPSPYRVFTITDGCSKKQREISAPKFYPDQVVHWAVMQIIQPHLERSMYHLSCGSRQGKGAHYGKRYLERWLRNDKKHTKYCLKLDIKKYYPSINHDKLKELLRAKFKDDDLLHLLDLIIDSTDEGIPIGNYTSQWFANFYLTPLDHYIKETLRVKYYIRYMDDMILLGGNKKDLHKAKDLIEEFIKPYGLTLKENWQVFRVDDRSIDFMGFRFYHDRTVLRRRTALRIRRRVRKAYRKLNYANATAVISYLGWIKHADMHNFHLRYIQPYFNIKKAKEVIRNESRKYRTPGFAV